MIRIPVEGLFVCALLGGSAVGCSSATHAEASASGTMSMALSAISDGHTYRLVNEVVVVSGPTYTWLSGSGDSSESVLTTTLATGNYSAYLYNWSLQRDDGSGNFSAVQANLVSPATVYFAVFNGATSTVSYQFETDGVIVTTGAGNLAVRAEVHEIPAVCVALGTDCSDGTWCPPTGLTGAPRGCVFAGAVDIGQPCASPLDCVANASCFDFGSGPVCARLCASSDFDQPCNSTTTCASVDREYGICRPSAVEGP
jgi:hypothetical protein